MTKDRLIGQVGCPTIMSGGTLANRVVQSALATSSLILIITIRIYINSKACVLSTLHTLSIGKFALE